MERLKSWAAPNSYKYSALPSANHNHGRHRHRGKSIEWTRTERHQLILKLVTFALVLVAVLYVLAGYM